ncbi:MAG TPA: type II toxin-antitoxin system VapC family toxin [Terriglobia bacterium]|nr:type II toxin-antitoxin system VapC family toxin [Terriglobia bacterium]
MITALDTNILLDILAGDEGFAESSLGAVEQAAASGSLVICDVVYAEISTHFDVQADLERFLDENSIDVQPLGRADLFYAGRIWKKYRASGGTRSRILADFLIGAHAEMQALQLLSRDRGFYRDCFSSLSVFDPRKGRG